MPAVNRERKHNSNPMGKRKHWYLPCIAPALAALLLAGCGATVDLNEQATAETAMAVQWVPNGSVYTTAAEELEYWSTAQKAGIRPCRHAGNSPQRRLERAAG